MGSTSPMHRRHVAWLLASFALALGAPGIAAAVDFPVSGTITVNGNAGALPDGGLFGPSTYDTASGAIASGRFTFPQISASISTTLGTLVVIYQFSQTNMSSGQVASDGNVALTIATMRLQVLSATLDGFPIPTGSCSFEPIDLMLDGIGSAAGLGLADAAFTIPPVLPSDCGGYGSEINQAVAGSNNSIEVTLTGDFTPPTAGDTIFGNGFDPRGL